MKKVVSLILLGVMVFTMSACNQLGLISGGENTLPVLEHQYDPDATAGRVDSQFKDPSYPELPDNSYGTPVIEEATYELAITRQGGFGIVDLSTLFTSDVFSSCNNPTDGMFDDVGSHFSSKDVPHKFTYEGVPYVLGSFDDGESNAVRCVGQIAKFSEGFTCDGLKLILTTRNGDTNLVVTVIYSDGTVTRTAVSAPDWCNHDASGRAFTVPHAHVNNGENWETRDVRYLFCRELDLDAGKTIVGIQIGAYNTVHLLSMTITGMNK